MLKVMIYDILLSDEAQKDIFNIYAYIHDVYQSPLIATRYAKGIDNAIRKLSIYAGSMAISQNTFVQLRYGPYARRINYKKMAIIYTIEDNYVLVKSVIAASLIR